MSSYQKTLFSKYKAVLISCLLLLPISSQALTYHSTCMPPTFKGLNNLVQREDLITRIKKYDTSHYFRDYLISWRAIEGNVDVKQPSNPNNIILELIDYDRVLASIRYDFNYQPFANRLSNQIPTNGYDITEQEKKDIILLINLLIDDDKKAHEIYQALYNQYLEKVRKKEIWQGCEYQQQIVATIKYQGIDFDLHGYFDKNTNTANLSSFIAN